MKQRIIDDCAHYHLCDMDGSQCSKDPALVPLYPSNHNPSCILDSEYDSNEFVVVPQWHGNLWLAVPL